MDLNEQITASKLILTKSKYLIPFIFLENDKGILALPIDEFLENNENKQTLFHQIIPQIIQKGNIHEMMFISESWYVSRTPENFNPMDPPLPSQQPDKKEAINIVHITSFGVTSAMIPFKKENNNVIFEKEEIMTDTDQAQWYLFESCINLIKEKKHAAN